MAAQPFGGGGEADAHRNIVVLLGGDGGQHHLGAGEEAGEAQRLPPVAHPLARNLHQRQRPHLPHVDVAEPEAAQAARVVEHELQL